MEESFGSISQALQRIIDRIYDDLDKIIDTLELMDARIRVLETRTGKIN